ncbi:phosphotransferase [Exiguobacterium acetylicum]|uniref:phosphotransferase n=1 Tax=Exiguobacterium acetylicum TaxID=41170 RepID=UPI000681671A|nr:phosphotransferase [Exiguobacterium acetylicum]KNH35898.1 aminoglycoside phosphotransferase [Exiguobacterium acetylicum]
MSEEQRLTGGNVSAVYQKGEHVYRSQKENSKNVQRLLRHLEAKRLSGVPRFVGIDEQNREILTFLPGETADYPLKAYMWHDDVLDDVARLMRKYHDATVDFEVSPDWAPLLNTPSPYEVICHNDFAVYNTIFEDQKLSGVIDFDLAAPGPRAWDIVYALYTFVPLSNRRQAPDGFVIDYAAEQDDARFSERVSRFLDAYGYEGSRSELLSLLLLRVEALYLLIDQRASDGDAAFIKMKEDGHDTHYRAEYRFIAEHGEKWLIDKSSIK